MIVDFDKKDFALKWDVETSVLFNFCIFLSFIRFIKCAGTINISHKKSTQKHQNKSISSHMMLFLDSNHFIVILQLQNRSDILSQQHTYGKDKRAEVKWIINMRVCSMNTFFYPSFLPFIYDTRYYGHICEFKMCHWLLLCLIFFFCWMRQYCHCMSYHLAISRHKFNITRHGLILLVDVMKRKKRALSWIFNADYGLVWLGRDQIKKKMMMIGDVSQISLTLTSNS